MTVDDLKMIIADKELLIHQQRKTIESLQQLNADLQERLAHATSNSKKAAKTK